MATEKRTVQLKLYMTGIEAANHFYSNVHFFEPQFRMGRKKASFGYVIKGNVTLHSMGIHLHIQENELFYIPAGIHYNSEWYGNPDINFYSIQITEKAPDISEITNKFALQRIDAFCNTETRERIQEIYQQLTSGNQEEQLRGVGLFYFLYADILPTLTKASPVKYNPVLSEALRYIDRYYREEFSVDALAAKCAISASRLFHLFRDELNTTPIRYRNELRVERAAEELRLSDHSIEAVASHHGFHSATYFREIFKEYTKLTPSEYRTMTQSKSS